MGKANEDYTMAKLSQEPPLEPKDIDLEPEFASLSPELASLSPELDLWQAGSIAAELSPDITFDDIPE